GRFGQRGGGRIEIARVVAPARPGSISGPDRRVPGAGDDGIPLCTSARRLASDGDVLRSGRFRTDDSAPRPGPEASVSGALSGTVGPRAASGGERNTAWCPGSRMTFRSVCCVVLIRPLITARGQRDP